MKPVDWSKPIKFKGNDNPVRFASYIKTSSSSIDEVVIIYLPNVNRPNEEVVSIRNINGLYGFGTGNWDVINVPVIKKYYVNVYKGVTAPIFGEVYETAEEAERWSTNNNYIKTMPFEVEE